jgi:hypothetical protein
MVEDPKAAKALSPQDVLMYVKSEEIIRRVLPPDAQDEAIRQFRAGGYYSSPLLPTSYWTHGNATIFDAGNFGNKPITDKEIPKAESEAIDRACAAIYARGKRLHIVDVGKESALRRVIAEHLHHLHDFPVLVRVDGRRLEGAESFTEENLEKFLSN